MTSPQETLRYYQELPGFLGSRLGRPVRIVQRKTYQEVNDSLARGELDAAFLCSGGYVAGGEHLAPELLAVPVIGGRTSYRAYIIVHRYSGIRSFADLRQHSFAFTDPLSNTGWLYPVSKLTDLGSTPAAFFSQVTYTQSHDRSIEAVARQIIDGASVDSLVYEHLARHAPEKLGQLMVIERSPEFGTPPVVASPSMERTLKRSLAAVLLAMHNDPDGSRILHKLSIDRFVTGDPRAYDSIRQMARKVGPWRP
jgi:phosphonate transport system substrate-binding protein